MKKQNSFFQRMRGKSQISTPPSKGVLQSPRAQNSAAPPPKPAPPATAPPLPSAPEPVRDGMRGMLLVKRRGGSHRLRSKESAFRWQKRFAELRFSADSMILFDATGTGETEAVARGKESLPTLGQQQPATTKQPVMVLPYSALRSVTKLPESKKKGCCLDLVVDAREWEAVGEGEGGLASGGTTRISDSGIVEATLSLWAESQEAARRWHRALGIIIGTGAGVQQRMRAATQPSDTAGNVDETTRLAQPSHSSVSSTAAKGVRKPRLSYFKGTGSKREQLLRPRSRTRSGERQGQDRIGATSAAIARAIERLRQQPQASAATSRRGRRRRSTKRFATGGPLAHGRDWNWDDADAVGAAAARPSVRSWARTHASSGVSASQPVDAGSSPVPERRLSDSILALPRTVRRFSQLAASGQIVAAVEAMATGAAAGLDDGTATESDLGKDFDTRREDLDGRVLHSLSGQVARTFVNANKLRASVRKMKQRQRIQRHQARPARAPPPRPHIADEVSTAPRKGSVAFDVEFGAQRRSSSTIRQARARSAAARRLEQYCYDGGEAGTENDTADMAHVKQERAAARRASIARRRIARAAIREDKARAVRATLKARSEGHAIPRKGSVAFEVETSAQRRSSASVLQARKMSAAARRLERYAAHNTALGDVNDPQALKSVADAAVSRHERAEARRASILRRRTERVTSRHETIRRKQERQQEKVEHKADIARKRQEHAAARRASIVRRRTARAAARHENARAARAALKARSVTAKDLEDTGNDSSLDARKSSVAFEVNAVAQRRSSAAIRQARQKSAAARRLERYDSGNLAAARGTDHGQLAHARLEKATARRESLLRRRAAKAATNNLRAASAALNARHEAERNALLLQLTEAEARQRDVEDGVTEEGDDGTGTATISGASGKLGRDSMTWLAGWLAGGKEGGAQAMRGSKPAADGGEGHFARTLLRACAQIDDNMQEDDNTDGNVDSNNYDARQKHGAGSEYWGQFEYSYSSDSDSSDDADFDHFWDPVATARQNNEDGTEWVDDYGAADAQVSAPSWRGMRGWELHEDDLLSFFKHKESGRIVMRYVHGESAGGDDGASHDGVASIPESAPTYFYVDPETGESSWEAPCTAGLGDDDADDELGDWVTLATDEGQTYYYNPRTEESRWERPSQGWCEYEDEWGRTYYHNSSTGESSWEQPADVQASATSSSGADAGAGGPVIRRDPQRNVVNVTGSDNAAALHKLIWARHAAAGRSRKMSRAGKPKPQL